MPGRIGTADHDEHELSGFDEVGPGFMMPDRSSRRSVKVVLPVYPTQQGTPRKAEPPTIIVDINSKGSELNIELTFEGKTHTPEEYREIMKFMSNLV